MDKRDFGEIEHTLVVDFPVIMPTIGIGYSAHSPKLPLFSMRTLAGNIPAVLINGNSPAGAIHPVFASHYQPSL